jgi:meso-butanediol dehydrogenase/(S,S)-butanediol dehydrogenase/diacetyl reductase
VAELAAMRGISEEEAFQEWVGTTPLRRPQTIRDIGEMVSFLASARAANITGLAVSVTGGRVLH